MTIQTMVRLLGEGFLTTLAIFMLTLIGSLPLGLLVYFGKKSRIAPLRWVVNVYISIMRGTPLILQLMVVYFGPNLLFGLTPPSNWRFLAVIVGFIINYAAYFAEIFRGGIQAVPVGQKEAAKVLGMSRMQSFFRIQLPQLGTLTVQSQGNGGLGFGGDHQPPVQQQGLALVGNGNIVKGFLTLGADEGDDISVQAKGHGQGQNHVKKLTFEHRCPPSPS